MPSIDLRSIILLVGVMGLLMSAIIFFLRRSLPPTIGGLREWAAAPAIVFVSMVLLALRGSAPDFISVFCGNLLLLSGCLLFLFGAQRFFGVSTKMRSWIWPFVLTLSLLALTWCTLIEPDYGVRLRVMATLMFAIFITLGLLVHRQGGSTFSGRFTAIVLFVQSTVILLRFIATFVWPSGNGLFEPFVYQTLYIASFAFTMLLLTVGTVLLANERMRIEFHNIIAERKQAESALAEKMAQLAQSESRLSRAMDATSDGLWEWNVASGQGYFSPAYYRMLGYGEGDFASAAGSWLSLIHPEDRERALAANQNCIDGRTESFATEFRMRAKDGSWRWILGRGKAMARDASGKALLMVGTHADITERKQAEADRARFEAQLRESQKMEALGTMAGGVAHDFNNALAMITGNAELARQDVGPGHPALVSLEEIAKASRRAKDLVQQILAFSRRQKLERKATSLALVVVESARLIRATLPVGVSLNVECKADAPAVLADATQIKQILLNLCGNATHAIQDLGRPGVIEISLSAYDPAGGEAHGNLPSGRYACLAVRDDGPGMDEATRSRIFEPFFTTKPVGKGTGLGLAVVHGIVQAHEASIEVQSAPGKGSAFRIYFPAIDAPVAGDAPAEQAAAPVHGAGKHVLYVDDEEAIIFLMTRLLERQGFRVSGYTDPREALAAARADPGQFDLVVTDYNMPGMSGLAVASALREIRADLPVVLASGYITEELRQKAPAAGVRELIYKPNTIDDLCDAVARFANAQKAA